MVETLQRTTLPGGREREREGGREEREGGREEREGGGGRKGGREGERGREKIYRLLTPLEALNYLTTT